MSIDELVEQLKQLAITKDAALREECEALQFVIKMAALKEREACAGICDLTKQMCEAFGKSASAAKACADAIRARGNE